jgi:Tol biopolymer transport system component
MTWEQRLERDLPELLEQLGMGPSPDYRDDIVHRTAAMHQRPAWTFPERWLPMDTTAARGAATPLRPILIVVLIALAIVAAAVVAGNKFRESRPAPPYGPAANGQIAYSIDGDIRLGDPSSGTSRVLIGGPTMDTYPYLSLDGESLLFVRQAEGTPIGAPATVADLYLADARGGDIRRLTGQTLAGETTVVDAVWRGDSEAILLTSMIDGRPELTTVDVADGSRRRVDLGRPVFDASFVPPDDRRIVFRSVDATGVQGLYVVDADAGEPSALTDPLGTEDFEFAVSPEGRSVAYSATDASGTHQTHVVDLRSGVDRILPLAEGALHQGLPAWSPDGRWLLVGRARDISGPVEVVLALISPDGAEPGRSLEALDSGERSWAPDGSGILVVRRNDHALDLITALAGTKRSLGFAPDSGTGAPDWQRLAP